MKLNTKALNLLQCAFTEQHRLGIHPMPKIFSNKKCKYTKHVSPCISFTQSGDVYFNCDTCGKDIIPSGFKTKRKV